MNITARDVQLLRYLHTVKVATYKQIQRDVYPDYKLRSVCNRLAKLERRRLVTGSQNRLHSCGDRVISVSKEGFEKFIAKGEELRCELKSEAITHDLNLVDIRHSLMKLEKVSFYATENQIQTWGDTENGIESIDLVRLNSDALMKIHSPKKEVWCAVEYEDSEKASKRYEPIVKKYYLSGEIGAVFYVCKSENLVRKISKIESTLFPGDQPKFFYQVKHALHKNDVISFFNCNGFTLNFTTKKPDEQVMNY